MELSVKPFLFFFYTYYVGIDVICITLAGVRRL
jgi:hypothetical protein